MLTKDSSTTPLPINDRVEAVVRFKAQCRDDPELRALTITRGKAADEVQAIKQNLVSGLAIPQTVAMVKEETSSALLGVISVQIEGRLDLIMAPPGSVPEFMRKLAASPFIRVMGTDDEYAGSVLADGETHLGVATVRYGVELASRLTGRAPEMWATVKKTNGPAKRALKAVGFRRHPGSDKLPDGDVFVRRSGLPLPQAPPSWAYRPLNTESQHEYPLAA